MRTKPLSRRPPRSATRLSLEPLEDRCLLSTYALTDLGALVGPTAQAYNLNDAGHVVGAVNGRAFLLQDGIVTDLGTLGGLTSQANGVNNWGAVVGASAIDPTISSVAFLWYDGVMYDLGLGDQSSAAAINDWGQIVGTVNGRAFLWNWQDGVVTDLGTLGGPDGASATDLNNAGQVTGTASSPEPGIFDVAPSYHAFVWQDGVMTSLASPFTFGSSAASINNFGQVVGSRTVFLSTGRYGAFVQQAFFYDGSAFIGLPVTGVQSGALDINDAGQIVGWMSGGAFIYDGGVVRNLNSLIPPGSLPGVSLTQATDINNAGQILARASSGRYYLLTPDAPVDGPEVQVWLNGAEIPDEAGAADFGSTLQGTPVTRTFYVRNVGSQTLTLSGPIALPPGFTLVSGFSATALAPGGLAQFVVRMTAAAMGSYGGQLSFGTNDPDENPFNFTVSGTVPVRVIDDGVAGFSAIGFSLLSGQGHQNDVRRALAGTGSATATWTFASLAPGTYRVSVTWTGGTNRATNAPFTVLNGSAPLATAALDQRFGPNDFFDHGVAWKDLGTFTITGGTLAVRLTNLANGWVIADAVRVELVAPDPGLIAASMLLSQDE